MYDDYEVDLAKTSTDGRSFWKRNFPKFILGMQCVRLHFRNLLVVVVVVLVVVVVAAVVVVVVVVVAARAEAVPVNSNRHSLRCGGGNT